MNYAEEIIKLRQHVRDLGDAALHNRWYEAPTLIKAMRLRMDRLEVWAKQQDITWAESRNSAAQSAESSETK